MVLGCIPVGGVEHASREGACTLVMTDKLMPERVSLRAVNEEVRNIL